MFNKESRKLHPDKGGTKDAFVALFEEYEHAKERFSQEDARASTQATEEPGTSPCGPRPRRPYRRTPCWADLPQEDLWALMKKEREVNEASMRAMNEESLLQEEAGEESFSQEEYTEELRALLLTDFDTLGCVAQLAVKRKGMSPDEMLDEMKRKREKKSSGAAHTQRQARGQKSSAKSSADSRLDFMAVTRVGFSDFLVGLPRPTEKLSR